MKQLLSNPSWEFSDADVPFFELFLRSGKRGLRSKCETSLGEHLAKMFFFDTRNQAPISRCKEKWTPQANETIVNVPMPALFFGCNVAHTSWFFAHVQCECSKHLYTSSPFPSGWKPKTYFFLMNKRLHGSLVEFY